MNTNPTITDNRRDSIPLRNNDETTSRNQYNTRSPEIDLSTRNIPDIREDDLTSSTRNRIHRTTVRPQNNRNPSVRYFKL